MDLNILLENEPCLENVSGLNRTIQTLNRKNIYTVNDFLNTDLNNENISFGNFHEFFKVMQQLLAYIYLNKPISEELDLILSKRYFRYNQNEFTDDIKKIGLSSQYSLFFEEQCHINGCTMVDLFETLYKHGGKEGIISVLFLKYIESKYLKAEVTTTDVLKLQLKKLSDLKKERNEIKTKLDSIDNEIATIMAYIKELEDSLKLVTPVIHK